MSELLSRARVVWHGVIAGVRLADLLDVLIVALLVYFMITWFRRARSRFVIGGFVALAGVYVVALALNMYLTLLVFQALITVALIAVVVIFQEDIRRGFERIAIRGQLRAAGPTPGMALIVDAVVEAASQLANRRIGALIVFRGKEPLERHVTGGVVLDGRVSEALLYSIFDPHSAGHDGAAVIDAGLLRMFSAHLPLSTRGGGQLGTRHTAALGLSERSDAFVIVVSEERGTISIARMGELSVVKPAELKKSLDAFVREVTPERAPTPLRRLVQNPGTKGLSLAIAIASWVLLFGPQRETIARTYSVPIVYRDVPSGWLLDEPEPLEARVTLTGPSRGFEMLDRESLTISLDASELHAGSQRLKIDDSDIDKPRELMIHRIEPAEVTVVAHPTVDVELPVKAAIGGGLPTRLRLVAVTVNPDHITVALRRSERGSVTRLLTEPIDLSRIDATTTLTRALKIPSNVRLPPGAPTEVRVRVEVAAR